MRNKFIKTYSSFCKLAKTIKPKITTMKLYLLDETKLSKLFRVTMKKIKINVKFIDSSKTYHKFQV